MINYKMLTVNELFSGIGSQRCALDKLGINYNIVGISEIDKFALQSYNAIFGNTYNYGDINNITKLNYADLWTYTFPCTDISLCGKQRGIIKNKTKSGLLYEIERLLKISKNYNELPKYLMLENVKNLVGKKFKPYFIDWLNMLNKLGYNNYCQILNSMNYGIPQDRDRVFVISIRKDIDTNLFKFPSPIELTTRLKDYLEDNVDDKYYLKPNVINNIINWSSKSYRPLTRVMGSNSVIPTITANGEYKNNRNMIILSDYLNNTKNLEIVDNYGNIILDKSKLDIDNTDIIEDFKIRRLTPCECWRLMGYSDDNFNKVLCSGISDTQLYKQAGNAVVIDVLYYLFKSLCKAQNIS